MAVAVNIHSVQPLPQPMRSVDSLRVSLARATYGAGNPSHPHWNGDTVGQEMEVRSRCILAPRLCTHQLSGLDAWISERSTVLSVAYTAGRMLQIGIGDEEMSLVIRTQ